MTVELVPASQLDFADFTQLLNDTYADYYVPLNMSVSQMQARVSQDGVRMDLSVVALADGQPVGLAMLAQRDRRAWVGGVGVLPDFRRQGIGRRIMERILANARTTPIQTVQLEVITLNTAARTLYDALGFEEQRVLHVAEGHPPTGELSPREQEYDIVEMSVREALSYFRAYHRTPVPWQREIPAIQDMAPHLTAYAAMDGNLVAAYVIGVFRPEVIRFVDLAHAPRMATGLRALLRTLHNRYPTASGSIINIGEDDPAWAVLFVLGYRPELSQHEMVLRL
jgi:GNAT superfamily N-acetyltransferase